MNFRAMPECHAENADMEAPDPNSQATPWRAVTLTECRLGDSDLPPWTARRTCIRLQMSAPVVVELGFQGRFQPHLVGPGTFCVIPAGGGAPAARWSGERRILQAELSPLLIRSVADSHDLHTFQMTSRHAISDPRISNLLLALREELFNANPSGTAYVDMIARAITIRLLRAYAVFAPLRHRGGGLSRPLLRRLIDYIDAHLDRNLGLRGLAALSGLSQDHFARAFRETTGLPPHRFLIQRRLARARRLLETTKMPIADVAHTVGFADQSHLTNLFRRNMGLTPRQIRTNAVPKSNNYRNSSNDAGIVQEFHDSFHLTSL